MRLSMCLLAICFSAIPAGSGPAQVSIVARLPFTLRADMIATAKSFAAHTWTCGARNLRASCSKNYRSDWRAGERVKGIPYCWGGFDTPQAFDQKVARGLAAGAHSRNGVLSCAAGVDCSAFICACWGLKLRGHPYSTRNLRVIAGRPKYNWFTDMKPGDVLNKPGSHVVMFAGYNPDGTINIFEASGSAARVVFHKITWSRLRGYRPLQYKAVADN